MDGILLIDKEKWITSYDIIRRLKPLFPRKYKIGHAGTLDPFATGLVIILLGRGTKFSDRLMKSDKEYTVTAEFGYETVSQDPEGDVSRKIEELQQLDEVTIEAALQGLTGEIMQQPPIYSAKKVGGQKAYKAARNNETIELEPRKATVSKFEIVEYKWPFVKFDTTVSAGTYVRTLVFDLGRALESAATAVELVRTRSGKFTIDRAISSADISEENIKKAFIPFEEVNAILNSGT